MFEQWRVSPSTPRARMRNAATHVRGRKENNNNPKNLKTHSGFGAGTFKLKMSCARSNGGDQQKRPITIIGLEGSANKIGIGIVRDGEVIWLP